MYYDQILAQLDRATLEKEKAMLEYVKSSGKDNAAKEALDKAYYDEAIAVNNVDLIEEFAKPIAIFNKPYTSTPEFKEWKKAFKHEFLTQVFHGYKLNNIIEYLFVNLPNPGGNIINYIHELREEGYFYYVNPFDENPSLELTPKGLKYLEETANITLKR